jgi:hypothetical protein
MLKIIAGERALSGAALRVASGRSPERARMVRLIMIMREERVVMLRRQQREVKMTCWTLSLEAEKTLV